MMPTIAADSLPGWALVYARLGWPVFPLQPGSKVPLPGGHGFKDATADVEQVGRWWAGEPAANIGIPTGPGWFDVLDFDRKPGGVDSLPLLGRLAAAGLLRGAVGMARTRNGGVHLLFPASGLGSGALPRAGIDFKAAGGYVVVAPSVVASDFPGLPGCYRWQGFPSGEGRPLHWERVKQLLAPAAHPRAASRPGGFLPERGGAGLVRTVAEAGEGERNRVLFWAACRAAERGELDQLGDQLAEAARAAGLGPAEVSRTLGSARRSAGAGVTR